MRSVQAPYDIEVTGPSYLSLLDLSNAERLGNVTDGTMHLRVAQAYQNLEPNYGNSVNVTLVLATNSQVSSCRLHTAVVQNWQTHGQQSWRAHGAERISQVWGVEGCAGRARMSLQ